VIKKIDQAEWDFRGIDRESLGAALIYEYTRSSKKIMRALGEWLNSEVPGWEWRKVCGDREDGFHYEGDDEGWEGSKFHLKMWRWTGSPKKVIEFIEPSAENDRKARIPEEIEEKFRESAPEGLPFEVMEFALALPWISESGPWLELHRNTQTLLRKIYEEQRAFEAAPVVFEGDPTFLFSSEKNLSGVFQFRANWRFSDKAISAAIADRVRAQRPKNQPPRRRPGRSAAPPFEALKWLAAYRLSKAAYNFRAAEKLLEKLPDMGVLPKYTYQSGWDGAIAKAEECLRMAESGNFDFAKVETTSEK
jgi:hypothetical protein